MSRRRLIAIVVGGLLLAYLGTGFTFVAADERGVVRVLGRPQAVLPPGLHLVPPRPFARVDVPRVDEVRRQYVGLLPGERNAIARGNLAAMSRTGESDLLTGDVNILKSTLVTQYQVHDPVAYLFATGSGDALVGQVVRSVLVESLAGLPVDEALTTRKAWLQSQVLTRSQSVLDDYGVGVLLLSTTFESMTPPTAVVDAFQGVVSAAKDAERLTDEAQGSSTSVLAEARGLATERIEAAHAYHTTRLARARGETARFRSLLAEYRQNPEVVRDRILLERLETILPRMRTVIVDDHEGDVPTDLRLIEKAR